VTITWPKIKTWFQTRSSSEFWGRGRKEEILWQGRAGGGERRIYTLRGSVTSKKGGPAPSVSMATEKNRKLGGQPARTPAKESRDLRSRS